MNTITFFRGLLLANSYLSCPAMVRESTWYTGHAMRIDEASIDDLFWLEVDCGFDFTEDLPESQRNKWESLAALSKNSFRPIRLGAHYP